MSQPSLPWTIALTGPVETRTRAVLALEVDGLRALPSDHHAVLHAGSVTVQAQHPDDVVPLVEPHGWALYAHYPTPPEPSAEQHPLVASVAEMREEISALRGEVAILRGAR